MLRRRILVALIRCPSGHLCSWGSFETSDDHVLMQNGSSDRFKKSRKSITQYFKTSFGFLNGSNSIKIESYKYEYLALKVVSK